MGRLHRPDANAPFATAVGITFAPDSITLPSTNTGAPSVQINSAGTTITLAGGGAGNNTVRGLTLTDATTMALSGTSFGALTISEVWINSAGTGGALSLDTGTVAAGATIETHSATPTGGRTGILLSAITSGSLTVTNGTLSSNDNLASAAIRVVGGVVGGVWDRRAGSDVAARRPATREDAVGVHAECLAVGAPTARRSARPRRTGRA